MRMSKMKTSPGTRAGATFPSSDCAANPSIFFSFFCWAPLHGMLAASDLRDVVYMCFSCVADVCVTIRMLLLRPHLLPFDPLIPRDIGVMAGSGAVEIGGGMADYGRCSWPRRVRSLFSFFFFNTRFNPSDSELILRHLFPWCKTTIAVAVFGASGIQLVTYKLRERLTYVSLCMTDCLPLVPMTLRLIMPLATLTSSRPAANPSLGISMIISCGCTLRANTPHPPVKVLLLPVG